MTAGTFGAAVAGLQAAVDELLSADVESLGREALIEALQALEVLRHRLDAADQALLARAGEIRLAAELGRPSLADAVAILLKADVRGARARVRRAGDLGPRRSLTGEPLEPILPTVAEAMRLGAVSAEQADVIISAIEHLPDAVAVGAQFVVEGLLVAAAEHEPPRTLKRTAEALLARLDPDGPEPDEDEAARHRGLTLVPNGGGSRPSGWFDAELTAYLEAAFDSLAAPRPADDQASRDPRTAGQRRHDALLELLTRVLRSGTLPASGGMPVTVLATVTMNDLTSAASASAPRGTEQLPPGVTDLVGRDALTDLLDASSTGLARLGHGQTISARWLLHLACDAAVVPVVFDDAGGVLAYGRERRLATRGQRLALAARDGGCSFPDCDRPAGWTEVHHVREWAAGGATDLDNLCLLCSFHHRTFERSGWTVAIEGGVPTWYPPAWLDPQRRPRRNTAHHPPDIVFRRPAVA